MEGTNCVRLFVEYANRRKDSMEQCLDVVPETSVFIPDDDLINDLFEVKGSYINQFQIHILDFRLNTISQKIH